MFQYGDIHGVPSRFRRVMPGHEWIGLWKTVSSIESLEEVRLRIRPSSRGSSAYNDEELLAPLWKIVRPLRVFEVDALGMVGFKNGEDRSRVPFRLLET